MPDLLIELLSEEIPARMQARAADDLKRLVCDGLKAAGLTFDAADAYSTPRRLTLVVTGVPPQTPDVSEERRGPRTDAPEQAQAGFRKSLAEGTQVEERETPKGTFFFALVEKRGEPAGDVIKAVLSKAMTDLPWPKSMRWGTGTSRWVRPLQKGMLLFGGEALALEASGLTFGATTAGHPFMAPAHFDVSGFEDYKERLRAAHVILDRDERKAIISDRAKALCDAEGLRLKEDIGLLDEVAGLVEWPVVLMGSIDDIFMGLPDEVLTTSMKKHQKYFSVLKADGTLAPKFIVVANRETPDQGSTIRAGNERVLRARLSDAQFFWEQDQKTSLASKAPQLKERIFHAKLGTLDEKVDRMQALAVDLCQYVPGADRDKVRSAARLAKADLPTGMVGEFADLQGVMGSYYALHDGESAEVAQAIAEHYSPQGPGDICPTGPVSVCVALADKIDTLVGFFAIDEKPTGSKDPFALRRAALGVIRLVLENKLRLPLLQVFAHAKALYGSDVKDASDDLLRFFADRMNVFLRDADLKHDRINAVFALGNEDDMHRLRLRAWALDAFLATEDGAELQAAYKRATNILRIEEKKDGQSYAGSVDEALLAEEAEKALYADLSAAEPKVAKAAADELFDHAMQSLATVRGAVDTFFDKVTVNVDEPALRQNRLKLLAMIRAALEGVADFSKIEG